LQADKVLVFVAIAWPKILRVATNKCQDDANNDRVAKKRLRIREIA
jgi:hypothetical protein